jgi:hypothetical protein
LTTVTAAIDGPDTTEMNIFCCKVVRHHHHPSFPEFAVKKAQSSASRVGKLGYESGSIVSFSYQCLLYAAITTTTSCCSRLLCDLLHSSSHAPECACHLSAIRHHQLVIHYGIAPFSQNLRVVEYPKYRVGNHPLLDSAIGRTQLQSIQTAYQHMHTSLPQATPTNVPCLDVISQ